MRPGPGITVAELEAGYRAIATDKEHEREAHEWIAAMISDVVDEPGWATARQTYPTDKAWRWSSARSGSSPA